MLRYTFAMRNILLVLVVAGAPVVLAQSYEELNKDALSAKKAHDTPRLLSALERMNAVRPNHPTIMVNLVAANAMSGRADAAIGIAQRLLAMKVYFDASRSDFDSLRSDPRFVSIVEQLRTLKSERVAGAKIAFEIPQKGIIPEGIAYDGASGRFFVSSSRFGRIIAVNRKHRASTFFPGGVEGIHGLSGMGVDSGRHLLWACSTASERFATWKKGDPNDAAVVAFDLRSGKVMQRIRLDADAFCDDLTVARDGTVYVSDSSGAVLALSGGELRTLVPHGRIRSPQGSALSDDGRILYIADYGGPIRAVDVRSGDVAPLRLPDDFQSMGIDGIAVRGRQLIAVQNGIEPNRVVALHLDATGFVADSWRILEMNHPLIDEPTIGTFAGSTYHFIGSSQGNKFDGGNPDPAKLTNVIVFAIPLR
jgi:sugar lactone lactonase YvrE